MARRRRAPKPRKPVQPRAFVPVPGCQRSDGWTPERQVAFIEALAQSGCVTEACAAVGMSRQAAYRLRTDPRAASFRLAWERALTVAIRRVADNAYSRALNGVVTPIFFQGEQVGERVRHDERLVMFLMRYRDTHYYGRARDSQMPKPDLDEAAQDLDDALQAVEGDAIDVELQAEQDEDDRAAIERAEWEAQIRQESEAEAGAAPRHPADPARDADTPAGARKGPARGGT